MCLPDIKGSTHRSTPTVLLIILFVSCMLFGLSDAQAQPGRPLTGEVRSAADGQPIQGASVRTGKQQGITDKDGKFQIQTSEQEGSLEVKHLGYKTRVVKFNSRSAIFDIRLEADESQIEAVEVVSTGYQKIPRERATGSFEFVDSALFNRKVSTDFVSRLEDVIPGISSTKVAPNNQGNLLNINVRGVSTLQSERWPLVVIDGVPYENRFADFGRGAFNNINPNDIENITVLKDAAAASIWGAQSGNGVIVITTKRGKFNQKLGLSFNTNFTVKNKPDLYYYPQMNTSDYIDLQLFLFEAGRYDGLFDDWGSNVQPIPRLLKQHRDGEISATALQAEIDRLRQVDVRDDFLKYIYRKALNQQYSLRLSTGGERSSTSFSAGYDKNLNSLVTSSLDRLNLRSNTQLRPLKGLMLNVGLAYTEARNTESLDDVAYNQLAVNYPYMELADAQGKPLPVDISGYNPVYRDTVASGRLLDWSYVPLAELYASKQEQKTQEMFTQFSVDYDPGFGLNLHGLYAYQRSNNPISDWRSLDSYYQRDELNYHASWNANQVTWNLPLGDTYNIFHWNNYTHQARLSAGYDGKLFGPDEISVLAGFDLRELGKDLRVSQYYGFDRENGTHQSVQYGREVPILNGRGGVTRLIDRNRFETLRNRYVAFYANASYTIGKRYVLSGSYRKDASNLFGVRTNQRGQPFWSIGGAWLVSREGFMADLPVDLLKLRATYGYNGNVNNTVSAYPVMAIQSTANSTTGQNYATMTAPPNPQLRWEKVGILNLGADIALYGNRLGGSIEYYRKKPKDLIASDMVDPSVGFTYLTINSANLDTKGWDAALNGTPARARHWEWNTHLVFSYSRTKVVKAYLRSDIAQNHVSNGLSVQMTPIEGKDLFSLLTYGWAGLDPETGEPRTYVDGEISKDYIAVLSGKVDNLEYHGSQVPLYFGSFRNRVRYKTVELSWNIAYQLGHYFLRPTFSNNRFLTYGVGHRDYAMRWQKPGDEATTDVPAFTYPNNTAGSNLYESSAALVEKAGQIKWRDIQFSAQVPYMDRAGLKNCRIYAYLQNIGTIWRANKKGVDPEYGKGIPAPFQTSVGINFNL